MYKCIGCDKPTPWDGTSFRSYTCPCGSTTFISEAGEPAFVSSVWRQILSKKPVTHLNDIIGESPHTSPKKEELIKELRSIGFIWMEECEQCLQDGTLQRKRKREAHLAVQEAERILAKSLS